MRTLVTGSTSVVLAAGAICSAQLVVGSAALVLLVAASSHGNAQVLKQEPFEGKMVPGSVVLVDDGTCGKGKIKQVTGGEIGAMDPRPRTRKCIPKVTK